MEEKKSKKNSAKIIVIIAVAILTTFLFYTLYFIQQNQDPRSKAQTTTINPATVEFPSKLFAPFVDVSLYPLYDFSGAYAATQQKFYILAFITSSGSCSPTWGGTTPMNSNLLYDQINFLRSNGGDVIVSFGGEQGTELGQSCTTPEMLQMAYQQVITQYKIRWIDMDIEGAAIADTASIDRRNKALAALQAANPGLKVSYTLPVLPSGLTQEGLNLLSNAKSNGVNIAIVNLMTMNFGDSTAPNPAGKMGEYSVQAANSTRSQVKNLGITTSYGITPMIGQNFTISEIFLLEDSQVVITGSTASDISLLSMWSSSRDNGGCPNQGAPSATCSGIAQTTYDFTKAFQSFMGTSGNPPAPTSQYITNPTNYCLAANCGTTPTKPAPITSIPNQPTSTQSNPAAPTQPTSIQPINQLPSITGPTPNQPNPNPAGLAKLLLCFVLLPLILILSGIDLDSLEINLIGVCNI